MKEKENQRIVLTKRLLQESLLDLLEKKPIRKISITELCGAAGINRSTFYHHYGSQYDLLKEIRHTMLREIRARLDALQTQVAPNTEEDLKVVCTYLYENARTARLLFQNSDGLLGDTELFQSLRVSQDVENYLSTGLDGESKDLILTFLETGSYYMIRLWLLEGSTKTPEEMAQLLYHTSIHGWAG